jgi:hypothetical protein
MSTQQMRPLSDLPATEGFRFVGIRADGSRLACRNGVRLVRIEVENNPHQWERAKLSDWFVGWQP